MLYTGLPAENGEKAGKIGWLESGKMRVMSGAWSKAPRCQRQGGVEAEPPAAEKFRIFYLKKVNFDVFNCIICCNNVLCMTGMYYTNTKYCDM